MTRIHHAIGMGSDQLLDALPANRDKGDDGALSAAHDTLYSAYWCRLRPLPGAADLLRACRRHGLRVVLASKPAPDLVQVALKRAGVGPGEAVFVGDTAALLARFPRSLLG
ncbi:MAG TPA: HAD family hydrolase [Streptosporangiaceae bacterium]|jgi:phosphoglycolate phosphatase-like HAD superfamily hydrolase